ncbi:MAG: hypothetical protein NT126_05600 [Bacteroidetes bacterium]|nr:hypothetical protein [Bacteroidota bacterium]
MTKYFFLVAILFASVVSCQMTDSKPPEKKSCGKDSTDVNPNGSSELSFLMRSMHDYLVVVKTDVMMKKLRPEFPQEFLAIYTATPTDSFTKNEHFNELADAYVHAFNIFRSSTEKDVVENYNNIISACISCHRQHCPGPIMKIKKLLITETVVK